ncbi:glutathione S-transferase family protein [Acidocella sp.]|uniref:glutathione S-transferase family protein n=1 Tax=Acidocella sp. TaxID=50710 RepID=UPI002624EA99|nr:glutathione S-transferase [Acidocella sp.]
MEELELPYEIKHYTRRMMQAPPELAAIHPLGKSPIVTDGALNIAESGAIVEYLIRKAGGRFGPPATEADWLRYSYFTHYAEGSLMPNLVILLVNMKLGPFGWPLRPMFKKRVRENLAWLEQEMAGRPWFAGETPNAADVMMSFALEFANALVGLKDYPNLTAWLARVHARPAYIAGLQRGGPTAYY